MYQFMGTAVVRNTTMTRPDDTPPGLRYTGHVMKFQPPEAIMGTKPDVNEKLTVPIRRPAGTLEEQQLRREAAVKRAEGLWKDRTDIPKDGVEYQEKIRSEWS